MVTGIPPYIAPAFQAVRCPCGRYYLVFTGDGLRAQEDHRRAQAETMGAQLVDARSPPFLTCECGEVLDFSAEGCGLVM